tara:strand:+ start:1740 stop:1949 length:210 start_codon:yes stop_codon:yes gene_type:complete
MDSTVFKKDVYDYLKNKSTKFLSEYLETHLGLDEEEVSSEFLKLNPIRIKVARSILKERNKVRSFVGLE